MGGEGSGLVPSERLTFGDVFIGCSDSGRKRPKAPCENRGGLRGHSGELAGRHVEEVMFYNVL